MASSQLEAWLENFLWFKNNTIVSACSIYDMDKDNKSVKNVSYDMDKGNNSIKSGSTRTTCTINL